MESGKNKAREMKKDFVLAVVNSEGNLILEEKMDNAILASIEIALKKAYTAAALKIETSELAKLVQPNGSLYGLHTDRRYVVFGGGSLLKRNGEMGKEGNQRIPIEVSSFQEQVGSIKSLMEFTYL